MLKIEGCVESLCSYLLRAFPLHSWKRAPRVSGSACVFRDPHPTATGGRVVRLWWSLHAGVPSCSLAAQRECAHGGWSCRSIPPRRPCAEAPSCWMCRTATFLPHCTRTHTARGALVAPSRVRTAVIRRLSYYVRLARLQSRVWATRTEPAERWREPLASEPLLEAPPKPTEYTVHLRRRLTYKRARLTFATHTSWPSGSGER